MPPVHREDNFHSSHPERREERTLESVHDLTKRAMTQVTDRAPASFLGKVVIQRDDNDSDGSSITDASVYSEESQEKQEAEPGPKELLAKANERLRMQQLQDEIKSLKKLVNDRDEKLMQMTMQLRRATASKCDLVVACNDMEKQKEIAEQMGEEHVRQMKLTNLTLMEARAQMEREFMNELAKLSWKMHDMERKHRNQILEKDFEIAQLQEQMRRVSLKTHRKKKTKKKVPQGKGR